MPCCCKWYYFTLNGWVIHFSKRTGHGSFNVALEGYYKLRDPSLPASFLWNYLVVIIKLVSCLFGQLVGLFMSGHRVSSNSNWHKYLINLPLFVPPSSHLQFPSPASLSLMGWQHPSLLQTEPPPHVYSRMRHPLLCVLHQKYFIYFQLPKICFSLLVIDGPLYL